MMHWASFNFYRDWGYNLCYPQLFPHHKRPTDEGQRVAVEWGRDKSRFWLQVLERPLARRRADLADRRHDHRRRLFRRRPRRARRHDPLGLLETPNVEAWLGADEGAAALGRSASALDGFAASLKEQEFVNG